ncbi:alpha/beta hydrolase [Pseudomonas nicosulfuronedens]|uniref:Alpha/beta hydrolase n=1 Tax=Pseudomonas nicosulfuronedens TaxID=2571105 RepID=A0A5R9QY76_9PSED|nr:alpha/beta hydrolase [Pseudomonas nicosulfuronedens]MDH1008859.1 alpha/beta hydrolase [Pseudomonas nicosulfuronedens]MDH1981524.1 alpha/beta hydrolase [Pseudomonas nicosulfuronedens]MDH2029644.1 alpha/beta hydrolase [Pseudomonas nicosulfuronedens]TLX75117.1 alpha/beta hydrolase [Pseudomonas nicosulfuronedens]
MPEAFQPDLLRSLLRPLTAEANEVGIALYQHFYGLDLHARHPGLQSRLGIFEAGGYQIAAQYWRPVLARGTVVLLHGYYDHMGLYRHVIDWALDMGFAVLACDLPGHGLSGGAVASIGDFAEYQVVLGALLDQAQTLELPQPWHLCGQSTGGAILLDYLLTGAPRPELGRTILLAPLVRPRAWGWSKFSYQLLRPFVDSIPRRFSDNSNDAEFLAFLRDRDPLQPKTLPTAWVGALARWIPRIEAAGHGAQSLLVVQGDADETVDWRYNLKVLEEKFEKIECLLLTGARHHLANESETLRRRYFDFLSERMA